MPRKHQHDGWTPDRQRAFIEALADTGSVTHAARRINMSPEGAYHLRRQPGAESFADAWTAALDHGVQCLADLAIDRAKHGVAVSIMYRGEQVGERRRYNDRLLMWILRHHMPAKYSEGGRGDDLTPRARRAAAEAAERAAIDRPSQMATFIERINTMAERMAVVDPSIDLEHRSPADRLMYIVYRLWPEQAVAAGEAYMDEVSEP